MSAATYITTERYASMADLPVCLPETTLRRGSVITLASFKLASGQVAVVRVLNMNITQVETPGVIPDYINSSFGWCYVGVFAGVMAASPFISTTSYAVGVSGLNPASERIIHSPGLYTVKLVNNTGRTAASAVDFSVVVTGVIKIYA